MSESDELGRYLATFRDYPVLTDEKEFRRLFRVYKTGRKKSARRDAFRRIICGNIRLVVPIAVSLKGRGLPLLDMVQEGVFALDKALQKFDPGLGYRFSTYASWWIRSCISRAIHDTGVTRPMRLPIWIQEELRLVRMACMRHFKDHLEWPTPEEVLEIVHGIDTQRAQHMTLEKVIELLMLNAQKGVSLNEKFGKRNGDSGDGMSLEDTIPDGCDIESDIESLKLKERIEKVLSRLTPREAIIIRKRFGLDGKGEKTLEEISRQFDLTRERIRQIETKALGKIRAFLGPLKEEYAQLPS